LDTQVGEQRILWAIQEGNDKNTRVFLPKWMSTVIEMRICKYVSDYDKWQDILDRRESMGKGLTKNQDAGYKSFLADCQQRLVFNTRKQRYVGDLTTLKKQMKDCITFTLELSSEPEELMLTAANNQSYRLVLLKMSAGDGEHNECPTVLNQPASLGDICPDDQHEACQFGEDGDADAYDLTEAQVLQLEHEKADADAGGEEFQEEDMNEYEILCDSDDDLDQVVPTGVTGITRVKTFNTRPAWLALEKRSLVDIPRHIPGCYIAYHSTTQQWQGHYPQSTEMMSSTWGKSTKRSETESILRVVRSILRAHVNACPKDGAWKRQLDRVYEAEATV